MGAGSTPNRLRGHGPPAVPAPQEGKAVTTHYLTAAMVVLGPTLTYRREWSDNTMEMIVGVGLELDRLCSERLLAFNRDLTLRPNLCEWWQINPEGTELTIRLREGLCWSDGSPFTTQDVLSAFYYVRNQSLTPGRKVNVNITVDGRAVDTEVLVHRREELSSIFGRIKCLVIEPRLKTEGIFKQSGSIMIWITDDAYKIPIQVQSAVTFGSFVAKLKDAKNVPYKIKYPEK